MRLWQGRSIALSEPKPEKVGWQSRSLRHLPLISLDSFVHPTPFPAIPRD